MAAARVAPLHRASGFVGRHLAFALLQNEYNLAHRDDDALISELANEGIAYVPFFPLGGFSPLQSATLSRVASRLNATPMRVALAWPPQRSANILVIPGIPKAPSREFTGGGVASSRRDAGRS